MPPLARTFETEQNTSREISFVYKNWRGETALRTVLPIKLWYGHTDWHPQHQWLLKAIDLEKNEERDFALEDIVFNNK